MESQINHQHPTPLGNWLEHLFIELFYQQDDDICNRAMDEKLSSHLTICINGQHVSRENYCQIITETRRTYNISVQSSRELLASSGAIHEGITSVAHIQSFTLEDKKSGEQRKQTSLTISVIELNDGVQQLMNLSEIMLDH